MTHPRQKIVNDPVYGFISIPQGLIFNLIEHPYFQRLRRITQLGLSYYVYPGALHTRFHHALGAFHLTTQAIEVLRAKGVDISEEEATGASIAVLLHDIGHGPFSHALEHTLINVHHEELSVLFMQQLNDAFEGQLHTAMQIFQDKHPKKFLHQLVSGQLDMDRMDYLTRDSYFTGVSEGVIGYDRIIKMLSVKDNELVVEEKGIYSIEKFLIARRLMYWQVYLHKTVLSAEQMLIRILRRAKELATAGEQLDVPKDLAFFLYNDFSRKELVTRPKELLDSFARLDDFDIIGAIKSFTYHKDPLLKFLSDSLINRKLFRIELQNHPFESVYVDDLRQKMAGKLGIQDESLSHYLVWEGHESNRLYQKRKDEIKILFKNGNVLPMSACSDYEIDSKIITKYYLCYPKNMI